MLREKDNKEKQKRVKRRNLIDKETSQKSTTIPNNTRQYDRSRSDPRNSLEPSLSFQSSHHYILPYSSSLFFRVLPHTDIPADTYKDQEGRVIKLIKSTEDGN